MTWGRAKIAVRAALSVVKSEPTELASIAPLLEEAYTLLEKPCTELAVEEVEYYLRRAEEYVAQWRPVPKSGSLYIQPRWASASDEQISEALLQLQYVAYDSPSVGPVTPEGPSMKIFVSHSSKDKDCAAAFVEMLRAGLLIPPAQIRCTSVDGFKLSVGSNADERLRSEVFGCDIFVGLLSAEGMASVYVMFELGARWGSGRYMAPVRIAGFQNRDLKAPLSAIHSADGCSEAEVHQLLGEMASQLKIQLQAPQAYLKQLREFVRHASTIENTLQHSAPTNPTSNATHSKTETGLRADIISAIQQLKRTKGKAVAPDVTKLLDGKFEFGILIGELREMKDAGIVTWDGNADFPNAYQGIELV